MATKHEQAGGRPLSSSGWAGDRAFLGGLADDLVEGDLAVVCGHEVRSSGGAAGSKHGEGGWSLVTAAHRGVFY